MARLKTQKKNKRQKFFLKITNRQIKGKEKC